MPRGKDQKTISKRIDLHYWKKAHPLRTARRALIALCVLIAGGWLALVTFGTDNGEAIYNPGHVTSAHATIQHDCKACHAPDPKSPGGFAKAVSDTACLSCHEAPMHVPTQLVREGDNANNPLALAVWMKDRGIQSSAPPAAEAPAEGGEPAAEGAASASAQPKDAHHAAAGAGRLVSAQCAVCHVEHRSREALAAVSDSHCTQCHADLSKSMAGGKQSAVQNKVVAFAKGEHPEFGRRLPKDAAGEWVDPTKLKFGHKYHVVDQKLRDCTICHTTASPNLKAITADGKARVFKGSSPPAWAAEGQVETLDSGNPPFATEKDRNPAWASVANDGRYMQPVSFDAHCASCHPISVRGKVGGKPKSIVVPHVAMPQARAWLAAQVREMTLPGGPAVAPPPSSTGGRRRADAAPATPPAPGSPATSDQAADASSFDGADEVVKPVMLQRRRPGGAAATPPPATPPAGTAAPAPGAAAAPAAPAAPAGPDETTKVQSQLYAEYVKALNDACEKCHVMVDDASSAKDGLALTRFGDEYAPPLASGVTEDPAQEFVRLTLLQRRRPGAAAPPAPAPGAAEAKPAPGATGAAAAPAKPAPAWKAPAVKLMSTAPTGIPATPRVWFSHGRFDHRAHRDMSCVQCHTKLSDLEKAGGVTDERVKAVLEAAGKADSTALLSPGMEWPEYAFAGPSEGPWTVTTTTKSCVDCHRADGGGRRFTTAACVTCHAYHDHSQEQYPDGHPMPREKYMAPAPPPTPTPAAPAETPADGPPAEAAPAEAVPAETPAPADAAPAESAPAPEPAAAEPPAEPAEATPAEAAPAEPAPAEAAVPAETPAAEPAAKPAARRRPGGPKE